ncbi:MAG TPA: pyruvate, phosphate dikinase [Candidatus Limnocylindrales bacterium]|nr:pyruvate, phosphate dikinase [Candidatus Limnocylindrales bacterium]
MTHVYALDDSFDLPLPELKAVIGSKAANITVMANELRLPVPPGFAISTLTCREYLADGWPAGLEDELREHMSRVEARVGHRFGDPADPLLVSVRSGAPVSMPGMMDTILNLGLNDATEAGLAVLAGSDFAAACRTRLDRMFREIVGVDEVPEDPWAQLRGAVEAVFRSWNSDRARAYRRREGIPDDLGTAVTVQAMVFGNRGPGSGTGVLFTRNPATGEPSLYGDVMFEAQGEDVVAGTHRTEPIATLGERLPDVARELREYADRLERHYADLCDIEFTIEQGRLWMLQVRVGKRSPQAALRIAIDMAEDETFPLSRREAVERVAALLADPPMTIAERDGTARILTTGLPASPGIASGEIATTPEAAVDAADAGRTVILVRSETSPDDVHGMARAAGILTATGGIASHAAVVARGWGIPAVVGAAELRVGEGSIEVGERSLAAGETITIDGETGDVFDGAVAGVATIAPEAVVLLAWARELGIPIEAPAEEAAGAAAEPPIGSGATTAEDVVRGLLIKGYATPEAMAQALVSTPEELSGLLDRLVADGLAELAGGMFRLTNDGRALGAERIAADREAWGPERAEAALDAFLALDARMKETVTAWQLREVDGEQVMNDHADAAYDAAVMERLASLHADADAWLASLLDGLPRLGAYRGRLGHAAAQAAGGDHRYVASPRVDSYHGVWFELHEDLILLAGRSRADEVKAGRA